jgi:propanediol utilization protein
MKIPVGLSNHHVHVTREVGELLFGKGYELTCKRELKQIGEFACEEVVDIEINGNRLEHIRLIGPYRKYTQVELLKKDCDNLGVKKVRSDSGKLEGTIPFKLFGPKSTYEAKEGAFIANNHIHLSEKELKESGYNKGDFVRVATKEGKVINDIYIKSDPTCSIEFHINKDEGEALGLTLGDEITIIGKEVKDVKC